MSVFQKLYEAVLKDSQRRANANQLAFHLASVLNYQKQGVDMLYPDLKDKVLALQNVMAEKKMPVKIFQTWRSAKEQDDKYQQGRSKPGKIITNARGYQSYHQYGLAADIIFERYGWNPPSLAWWFELGKEGKKLGLVWGGDWDLKDYAHFEWHPFFTWQDLISFFTDKG